MATSKTKAAHAAKKAKVKFNPSLTDSAKNRRFRDHGKEAAKIAFHDDEAHGHYNLAEQQSEKVLNGKKYNAGAHAKADAHIKAYQHHSEQFKKQPLKHRKEYSRTPSQGEHANDKFINKHLKKYTSEMEKKKKNPAYKSKYMESQ